MFVVKFVGKFVVKSVVVFVVKFVGKFVVDGAPIPKDSHALAAADPRTRSSAGSRLTSTGCATTIPSSSSSLSRFTLAKDGRSAGVAALGPPAIASRAPIASSRVVSEPSAAPAAATAYVYLLGDQIFSSAARKPANTFDSPCNRTLRLSGVTLTSYASVGSRKSSTTHGNGVPDVV